MDSSANNSRQDASNEYERTASASTSTSPASNETATTISTIVLQSYPIQIVVGLLQVRIKNASSFSTSAWCHFGLVQFICFCFCFSFFLNLIIIIIFNLAFPFFHTIWPLQFCVCMPCCCFPRVFVPSSGWAFLFRYLSVFEYNPLNIAL